MEIQQIRNIVLLSTFALFTACVDQNSINIKKREEATLDIRKMPLQTYEEYIKVKRFALEKYIPVASKSATGIGYLNDGTKIKYYFDSKDVAETITHKKRPFIRVMRMYYPDSKTIKIDRTFISNLLIKKSIVYNHFGEISKVYDNEVVYRKKGLNYKKLLEGAEKQGLIDLKEGKMLRGDSFKIYIEKRKNLNWSRENKEDFSKEMNLSFEVVDKYSKSKYCWRFDINNNEGSAMYTFSGDGTFIGHFASSRRMRY